MFKESVLLFQQNFWDGLLYVANDCESILGNTRFGGFLTDVFDIMCIVAIALVLVLCSLDFFKSIVAKDQEMIKKSYSVAVKRLAIAVIMFFLPLVLDLILEFFGLVGVCI